MLKVAYVQPLSGTRNLEINLNNWRRLHYFAVGKRTSMPLEYMGCKVNFQENSGNKEELISLVLSLLSKDEELNKKAKNKKIIILEGDKNAEYIPNKLKENGYKYERLKVYETTNDPNPMSNVKPDFTKVGYIVFFSPSGIEATLNLLKRNININKTKIISIGKNTSDYLYDKKGYRSFAVAQKPTPESVLEIIERAEEDSKKKK